MKKNRILKAVLGSLTATTLLVTAAIQGPIDGVFSGLSLVSQVQADETSEDRPETFDLRDVDGESYVTSVKNQGLYGTCWSFAATSALETAYLFQLGLSNEDYIEEYGEELDLSERALAYFRGTPLTDESGMESVFGSQSGEGSMIIRNDSLNALFSLGGGDTCATSILSSGSGILYESDWPYHGENGDILYQYVDADGKVYRNDEGKRVISKTGDFSEFDDPEAMKEIYTAVPYVYDIYDDDWSLPESERYRTVVSLIESNMLTSPAITEMDEEGNKIYLGFDEEANNAIKDELLSGKAVFTAFHADTSLATDTTVAHYINNSNYAHFTYECVSANHAVTIVGYDDNYSRTNFLDHSEDEGGDGQAHLPEGDGAWIVKNSWGSSSAEFPNQGDWGVDGTGYFYISYYDRTLSSMEDFTLDISQVTIGASQYMVDEYDCMTVQSYAPFTQEGVEFATSNVFCTDDVEVLDHIGITSANKDAEVEAKIYLLNEDYTDPEDGTLVATLSDIYENAGYHTIYLDEGIYLPEGTYYSVVVTETITEGNETYSVGSVGVGFSEDLMNDLYPTDCKETVACSVAVVNKGESYVCVNGEWIDWADEEAEEVKALIPDYLTLSMDGSRVYAVYSVDNFPIKAFSEAAEGTVGNFTYSLDEDGVLTITGSGDINEACLGEYSLAPWLNLYDVTKMVVVDSDITDVFDENGNLSPALYGFSCWLQVGTGEDSALYHMGEDGMSVYRDEKFLDEETGTWYYADEDGIVTETEADDEEDSEDDILDETTSDVISDEVTSDDITSDDVDAKDTVDIATGDTESTVLWLLLALASASAAGFTLIVKRREEKA